MISEYGAKYPFVIMNTDRSDKKGTHWWSFLDLNPRKEIFMFDRFGFKGFKEFVIQDDQKIINKIFYGVENFDKKDQLMINCRLLKKTRVKCIKFIFT